jgi:hypothetical protein
MFRKPAYAWSGYETMKYAFSYTAKVKDVLTMSFYSQALYYYLFSWVNISIDLQIMLCISM